MRVKFPEVCNSALVLKLSRVMCMNTKIVFDEAYSFANIKNLGEAICLMIKISLTMSKENTIILKEHMSVRPRQEMTSRSSRRFLLYLIFNSVLRKPLADI